MRLSKSGSPHGGMDEAVAGRIVAALLSAAEN
jgi:hypothetical protein